MASERISRARTGLLVALAGALAFAVVAERMEWWGAVRAAGEPRPRWIWTSDPLRRVEPLSFAAMRDFELDRVPAGARMEVLGDPEYVAWLNGERIGSSAYRAGMPFDLYDVTPVLVAGRNRVVLELRSPIGSGAAALRIEDAAGRTLVETGADWYVFRRDWRGLWTGEGTWRTEHAVEVGRAPFGRWGLPAIGPLRPRFEASLAHDAVVPAVAWRSAQSGGHWQAMGWRRRSHEGLGGRVEFDFGREVVGYLHLDALTDVARSALIRYSAEPDSSRGWAPDEIAITLPRRGYWEDVEPRRFRYVEVVGLEEVSWAAAVELDERLARSVPQRTERRGLLGIPPPPAETPIADEIWKRWGDSGFEAPAGEPAG